MSRRSDGSRRFDGGRRRGAGEPPAGRSPGERYRQPALAEYRTRSGRAKVVGEITCRDYRPGDAASILEAFNETFKLQCGPDYWHWKFDDARFPRMVSVAVDEAGTVHGVYGAVPTEWQFDGARKLVGLAADVFSRRHPQVIRGNVFVRVLRHFLDAHLGPGRLSLIHGFAGLTPVKLYHHSVEPVGVVPVMVHEAQAARGIELPRRPVRERRGAGALDALDTLWPRVAGRYPRSQIRDAVWARRRFTTRPDRSYEEIALLDRVGVPCVWWVATATDDALLVCDLLWDGRPETLDLFDRSCRRHARKAGLERCTLMVHNDPAATGTLAGLGWQTRRHPENASWIMQSGDPAFDRSILDTVYLTFADSDLA
jgi:hypothetical protein